MLLGAKLNMFLSKLMIIDILQSDLYEIELDQFSHQSMNENIDKMRYVLSAIMVT